MPYLFTIHQRLIEDQCIRNLQYILEWTSQYAYIYICVCVMFSANKKNKLVRQPFKDGEWSHVTMLDQDYASYGKNDRLRKRKEEKTE